jgi:hypothetical protein
VKSYCQIYCQKRGGEGLKGTASFSNFSNLLISICVYVGSTKIAERFLDAAGLGAAVRSEAEDERPPPAASNPTLSAT